ncbi:MAG TPA: hypothetical protein VH877_20495 [Polyangia bacterium]|jgi:hypothetical protein|nr:hypothetical protein [Polyangia bacterium]
MNTLRTLSLAGLLGLTLTLGVAPRAASADERCHKVSARIADELVTANCSSPVGLCTAGTIQGDGLLHGTVLNVTNAIGPSATSNVSALDTTQTITTRHGTLVLHGSGLLDPVNGTVLFVEQTPTGTGIFAGVTGRLYINAVLTFPTSAEGEIRGELCLAR